MGIKPVVIQIQTQNCFCQRPVCFVNQININRFHDRFSMLSTLVSVVTFKQGIYLRYNRYLPEKII